MSLFGTSPPGSDNTPSVVASPSRGARSGLFDDPKASSSSLFADEDDGGEGSGSPWEMPTPRKQQSRADMVRNLLPSSDVPDSYVEAFDTVLRQGSGSQVVTAEGVSKVFAAAKVSDSSTKSRIMSLVVPRAGAEVNLGRGEFNVLMALVGLAQEGEDVSLDGVDERRRSK